MNKLKFIGALFLDALIAVGWFWIIMRGVWDNLIAAAGVGAALAFVILFIICLAICVPVIILMILIFAEGAT